jgi:hypothetical protein
MRLPPSYIAKSGILDAPADFLWKGEGRHYGPSQGTKVHEALAQLTTRGISTIASLTMEWLLWRFHKLIDLERYLHFVDSTLAWEVDFRYRAKEPEGIPDDTPSNQALRDAVWMVHKVANDDYWEYPTVNVTSTAALVSITKQVLPTKVQKAFLKWLEGAVATAAKLDPGPSKPRPIIGDFGNDRDQYRAALRAYFGQPLPREALDPEASYAPEQRDQRLGQFLASLDWKKNPFLRSPEEMQKLGFQGTPYKL